MGEFQWIALGIAAMTLVCIIVHELLREGCCLGDKCRCRGK